MSKELFLSKQIDILSNNKYVLSVSEKLLIKKLYKLLFILSDF